MRAIKILSLVVTGLCGATLCLAASEPDKPITVRVASYNVEFGKSATPEQIGEMFKPYKLDIIGFDEAPDGDWTARVGKVLGMEHCYVGKISSANHKDKYKSILSRTPLDGTEEHKLTGRGWNPASVVRAVTKIDGVSFAFYSLHICKSRAKNGHAHSLATKVLPKEITERVIVVGDFNNNIGDAAMSTIEGAGFRSTWKDLQIDVSKEFTYNAQNPEKNLGVIDHILFNTSVGARATDGGIIELEKPLSDHKPVWAEIVFPRNLEKVKLHMEPDPPRKAETNPTGNSLSTGSQYGVQDESKVIPLFNGRDLIGWTALPGGNWEVRDGVIIGTSPASEKRHGMLLSDKQYSDFEVNLEYKALSGNSGFYFRADRVKHAVSVAGFQAEIDASGSDAGGLYETLGRKWVVKPPAATKAFKPGEWNEMSVRAVGSHIVVHLNGIKTAELKDDPGRLKGHFGLQLHGSQKMDVAFRNIQIKELK